MNGNKTATKFMKRCLDNLKPMDKANTLAAIEGMLQYKYWISIETRDENDATNRGWNMYGCE